MRAGSGDDDTSDEDEGCTRCDAEERLYSGWTDCEADPMETAGCLAADGLVGLRGVFSAGQVQALSSYVDGHLAIRKRQATAADGSPEEPAAIAAFDRWFGCVRERRNRYDLKLDASEPTIIAALNSLCSAIGPIMEQTLTSEAVVMELSTLISDPGASSQNYHADSILPSVYGAPLITCFVALQDIEPAMGPTRWACSGMPMPSL